MKPRDALLGGAALMVLSTLGCQTTDHWRKSGIPSDKYLIGGGAQISWVAPLEGTLIVAERTSKQLLQTAHLKLGQDFTFEVGEYSEVIGVPVNQAKIQAFFIPAKRGK